MARLAKIHFLAVGLIFIIFGWFLIGIDWGRVLSSTSNQAQIIFVGDIGLGRAVNAKMKQKGAAYPFTKIAPFLNQADLVFANLEGPLIANCPVTVEGMKFCGDPSNAQGLIFAGINLMSVANNHIFDYGQNGFTQTVEVLQKNGIEPVGFDYRPVKEIGKAKVAFLAYDDVSRGVKVEQLKEEIEKVRKQVDLVVISFHWGNEYTATPASRQKELAHLAVDDGADLVVGHHPHWIQPEEIYKGKYIFYSLGNFVFDQMWSEATRNGLILIVSLEGKEITSVKTQKVYIEDYCQPRLL